ncbi:MAG: phosphate ABC transporter substrate-binding protein [Candidatus Delongbacteria bacterium]
MISRTWTRLVLLACVAGLAGSLQAAPVQVDKAIPVYKKVEGIKGNANSIGSDTMNNLMALWLEAFRKHYPQVTIQIEGKGSSTAPPALIEGTAQFGPMSRPMKSSEIDQFEAKFGFAPTAIKTSLDALAVFVPKSNPVAGLGLDQVDAMFSTTRARGLKPITTWSQAGVKGALAGKPISLYGRNSASGTYGYFKEHALKKGDFLGTVKEQPGSAAVVQGVEKDPAGVGYSGIGYVTSGVRAVPIGETAQGPFYEASYKNVLTGNYPLARPLLLYVAKNPNKPLDPLTREFLKFILSQEGQQIVVKDGYLPLPAAMVKQELAKLGK